MGIGGMLIPLVSVAVTLTLLPALLAASGRASTGRDPPGGHGRQPGWTAWARLIVRRRWARHRWRLW